MANEAEARLAEAWDEFDREAEAILALVEDGADPIEINEWMTAARRGIEAAARAGAEVRMEALLLAAAVVVVELSDTHTLCPGCRYGEDDRPQPDDHGAECVYAALARVVDATLTAIKQQDGKTTGCHAGQDGDCVWNECPQLRDGEPHTSGRHCPLDDPLTDEEGVPWPLTATEQGEPNG